MSVNEQSTVMFYAARASYGGDMNTPMSILRSQGYEFDYTLDTTNGSAVYLDENTGFSVIALQNVETGDRILSFTGTEDLSDAWADVNLGWEQWMGQQGSNRQMVQNYLDRVPSGSTVHFTGHSLGGALAQYAAYDYVHETMIIQEQSAPNITLTTFNALGANLGYL